MWEQNAAAAAAAVLPQSVGEQSSQEFLQEFLVRGGAVVEQKDRAPWPEATAGSWLEIWPGAGLPITQGVHLCC